MHVTKKNGHRSGGGGALMFSSMCVGSGGTTDANRVYSCSNLTRKQKWPTQGSVINSHGVAFFNPSPFGNLDDALALKSWAEENKVAVIT